MIIKERSNRYSISRILREEKKSNDFFELMLGNISMEDLIALKLEIAFRSSSTPLLGFPIWKATTKFVRDAIFKYAYATGGSKLRAMRLLGMNSRQFNNYLCKLEIKNYYKEKNGNVTN